MSATARTVQLAARNVKPAFPPPTSPFTITSPTAPPGRRANSGAAAAAAFRASVGFVARLFLRAFTAIKVNSSGPGRKGQRFVQQPFVVQPPQPAPVQPIRRDAARVHGVFDYRNGAKREAFVVIA